MANNKNKRGTSEVNESQRKQRQDIETPDRGQTKKEAPAEGERQQQPVRERTQEEETRRQDVGHRGDVKREQ